MSESVDPPVSVRSQVLRDAERIVTKDRNSQYGEPEDVFRTIADLWTAYTGDIDFTKADVAIMLILLKVARLRNNTRDLDSWVDIAGYSACGAEVAQK